jgi:nitroimidazol reductase NimA-like FMN-containing flavoprotein (pyridoxamine 5'-phosphate oxidase superfamily)
MPTKSKRKDSRTIPSHVSRGDVSVPDCLQRISKKEPHAVLATEEDGMPYASLVAYALTPDLKGLVFATPRKTLKYENIKKNRNVSLLIDTRSNTRKDYMGAEAITIMGRAKAVRRGKRRSELADILTQRHPDLVEFVDSNSTALILVEADRIIHVGRFQTVTEWKVGK